MYFLNCSKKEHQRNDSAASCQRSWTRTPPHLNSINVKKKVDLSVGSNNWAKVFVKRFVKRGDDKCAPAEMYSNGTKKFYSFAAAHLASKPESKDGTMFISPDSTTSKSRIPTQMLGSYT